MTHVSVSDLFRPVYSKWIFSCFFAAIIGSITSTPFIILFDFDPRIADQFVVTDPIKTMLVMSIIVIPFLVFASYVYELKVRPLIINRGWNENSFFTISVVYFLSLIMLMGYMTILFLSLWIFF